MSVKGDDDDDDDDGELFFFFSPTGSAPLTAQGQPAGSARGTFTRWVLSRTRRWLLFLSLILSRARLFYPANLFKRTFNSARPRVPSERRRRAISRVQSTLLFRRGLSNFSRLLRKFNVVVVRRDAP